MLFLLVFIKTSPFTSTILVQSLFKCYTMVSKGGANLNNIALYRIMTIVLMAVRFFWQIIRFRYRYKNRWTEPTVQAGWENLLVKQAATYRETALRLEGLLIKIGQFMSSRADILPPVIIEQLSQLVDQVPAVAWERARQVLEAEWGHPYGTLVHKISVEPVASASIGEVYKGYLHNGTCVAIKIQRPAIERIIRTDFKAIKIVIWLMNHFTSYGKMMDLNKLYQEMTAIIGDELNFRKELNNGLYFQQRYANFTSVRIPTYYAEYSTRRVLVMEWIEGAKITDISFLNDHHIDRKQLAERLFNMFLEQLLKEGKFHADPHPGNILVTADGTIVLLDFGMVGTIRRQDTLAIRQLIEGILIEDYQQVIQALDQLGFLLPYADRELLTDVLKRTMDIYLEQDFLQLDEAVVQRILADMRAIVRDEAIQVPSELAFFGRAVSTFVGLLYALDPNVKLLELSKPLIQQWLASQTSSESGAKGPLSLLKMVQKYVTPLLKLPQQLEDIVQEPRRYRQLTQRQAQERMQTVFHQSRKNDSMLFVLFSFALLLVGIIMSQLTVQYTAIALLALSLLYYSFTLRNYKHTIQQFARKDDQQ